MKGTEEKFKNLTKEAISLRGHNFKMSDAYFSDEYISNYDEIESRLSMFLEEIPFYASNLSKFQRQVFLIMIDVNISMSMKAMLFYKLCRAFSFGFLPQLAETLVCLSYFFASEIDRMDTENRTIADLRDKFLPIVIDKAEKFMNMYRRAKNASISFHVVRDRNHNIFMESLLAKCDIIFFIFYSGQVKKEWFDFDYYSLFDLDKEMQVIGYHLFLTVTKEEPMKYEFSCDKKHHFNVYAHKRGLYILEFLKCSSKAIHPSVRRFFAKELCKYQKSIYGNTTLNYINEVRSLLIKLELGKYALMIKTWGAKYDTTRHLTSEEDKKLIEMNFEKYICGNCLIQTFLLKCGRCKNQFYCSKECQKKHWLAHKKVCTAIMT